MVWYLNSYIWEKTQLETYKSNTFKVTVEQERLPLWVFQSFYIEAQDYEFLDLQMLWMVKLHQLKVKMSDVLRYILK